MTYKFEMNTGKMQQPGRNVLAAAIVGLPDGEYVVHIQSVGDVAARIEAITTWYNELNSVEVDDPAMMVYLDRKASELALCLSDFAVYVSALEADEKHAELKYDMAEDGLVIEMQEAAKEKGAKFVSSSAMPTIRQQLAGLRTVQVEARLNSNAAKRLFRAWEDVLGLMRTKMTNLRNQR